MIRLLAAPSHPYIVFVDADLLILDSSLNLTAIAYASTADVTMSADSMDVANSGCMIVRTTSSSALQFFTQWLALRAAKGVFCDQHALNRLSLSAGFQRDRLKVGPSLLQPSPLLR